MQTFPAFEIDLIIRKVNGASREGSLLEGSASSIEHGLINITFKVIYVSTQVADTSGLRFQYHVWTVRVRSFKEAIHR